MTQTAHDLVSQDRDVSSDRLEERVAKPIKYWAVFGALCLAFAAYVFLSWGLSSDFAKVDPGPTPVPTFMKAGLITLVVIGAIGIVLMAWYFLIKPWRREGHITTDGIFVLSFGLVVWQDPLVNFMGPYFTYNSWNLNRGSWLDKVPGVVWPQGEYLAEPLALNTTVYVWCLLTVVLLGSALMGAVKRRNPGIGPLGLILWCFVFMVAIDLLAELTMMRLGYWSYLNTIESLTIFNDKYYRFPIYECLMWGLTWTALACLHYFKNDKGQTIAERGIEKIQCTPGQRSWLRFLSIFGVVNFIWLFIYTIPMQYFVVNSDAPPKDLIERSYFISGICGADTNYSCGGPGVPIPRPGSSHVTPNGELFPGTAPGPEPAPLTR